MTIITSRREGRQTRTPQETKLSFELVLSPEEVLKKWGLAIDPLDPPKTSLEDVLKKLIGGTIDSKAVDRYQRQRVRKGTKELFNYAVRLANERRWLAPYSVWAFWDSLSIDDYQRDFRELIPPELLQLKTEIEKQMMGKEEVKFFVEFLRGEIIIQNWYGSYSDMDYDIYSYPRKNHPHDPFLVIRQPLKNDPQPHYIGHWGEDWRIPSSKKSAIFPDPSDEYRGDRDYGYSYWEQEISSSGKSTPPPPRKKSLWWWQILQCNASQSSRPS